MATHLSTDIPEVGDFGLSIEPNKEVFVNVKADITIPEESIHGFSLDKRLCYFPLDYPLNYYRYYTPANCMEEAMAQATLDACKCVHYYMPSKTWKISKDLIGLICSHCLRPCRS